MFKRKSTTISRQLFSSLSPFLRFNRIFCLLPLEWKRVNKNYVITTSTAYSMYSLAMIILMVIGSGYGFNKVTKAGTNQKRFAHRKTAFVTYINSLLIVFISLIAVTLVCCKANKLIDFIDKLKNVDNYLKKSHTKNMLLSTVFTTYTLFLLISNIVIKWKMFLSSEYNFFLIFSCYFPVSFCYFVDVIVEMVYWQTLTFIKIRLVTLNAHLSKLFHDHKNEYCFNNVVITEGNIMCIIKQQQGDGKKTNISKHLQNLIKAYKMLFEATNLINGSYGFIILIVMLGSMFHIITTFYEFYSVLVIQKKMTVVFLFNNICWSMFHLLRVFLIAELCHGCVYEVKNASFWLCKLLNSGSFDGKVEKSMNYFLLYIKTCKIKFSVCGLVKIRRDILTTIAGVVTTYLAILFQFNE